MKIIGKKSASSVIKIFLIIALLMCIALMITVPVCINKNGEGFLNDVMCAKSFGIIVVCIYLSSIPAVIMLYEFIKIFSSLEKENTFNKKIGDRFLISSICSIIIGIIYGITAFLVLNSSSYFNYSTIIVCVFFSILLAMIFLMFGIGLVVLREIYITAVNNKEENDLTI